MDWNNLKVALTISRTGSLTRAAQVLGIDTSTAGRRLSTLEADPGVPLFVRTKAGFALTDAGELYCWGDGEFFQTSTEAPTTTTPLLVTLSDL